MSSRTLECVSSKWFFISSSPLGTDSRQSPQMASSSSTSKWRSISEENFTLPVSSVNNNRVTATTTSRGHRVTSMMQCHEELKVLNSVWYCNWYGQAWCLPNIRLGSCLSCYSVTLKKIGFGGYVIFKILVFNPRRIWGNISWTDVCVCLSVAS